MIRSSTPHSTKSADSASSTESESFWPTTPIASVHQDGLRLVGTRKVHYQPHSDWDFLASAEPSEPLDLDLMLPHYRAHNQPLAHRMSIYLRSQKGDIKAKICRRSRSPFLLRIDSASTASVTLYLPSDFSGTIRFPMRAPRLSLSAGFTNHIQPRVHFSPNPRRETVLSDGSEDEVEIYAAGPVQLRMWDVVQGTPESAAREAWRKFCRCASSKNLRAPAENGAARPAADWDFLLDD